MNAVNILNANFALNESLLGYSLGEFQALQLIVFLAFGVMDNPFAYCMSVQFLEI